MAENGRVSTGTNGLDEMLYGGVPEGNSLILQGPPGNEKDLIANQYIKEGLLNGEVVFVVLSTISPDEFRQQLKFIGINPKRYEASGSLRIVDWYSYKNERVKSVEEGTGKDKAVIKASFDLTNVGIAITKTIEGLEKKRSKRAVINLLSPALNSFGMKTVYNFAQATRAKCRQENITTIFLLDSEAHEAKVLSTFHQIFDGLIEVSRTRKGPILRREIIVLSMSGTPIMSEYKELEVDTNSIMVKGVETDLDFGGSGDEDPNGVPTLDDIFKGFLASEQKAEVERASLATARAEKVEGPSPRKGKDLPVRTIMFCPECNAELPGDAPFCTSCGAEFEDEEESVIFQCPNCGMMVREDDVNCPSCKISFDEEIEDGVVETVSVIGKVITQVEAEEEVGDEEGDAEVWDDEPEMELGGGADEEEAINPKDELRAMLKPWEGHGYDLSYFTKGIVEDPRSIRKEIMIFVSRAREMAALEKRIDRLKAAKLKKGLADLKRDVTSPDKSKRGGIEWSILELRGRVKQVARRKAARMKDKKVVKRRKRP